LIQRSSRGPGQKNDGQKNDGQKNDGQILTFLNSAPFFRSRLLRLLKVGELLPRQTFLNRQYAILRLDSMPKIEDPPLSSALEALRYTPDSVMFVPRMCSPFQPTGRRNARAAALRSRKLPQLEIDGQK
jgi:hypothetical protein